VERIPGRSVEIRAWLGRARQAVSILSVLAIVGACLAAYVAVIVLVVNSRPSKQENQSSPQALAPSKTKPSAPPDFPASDYTQSQFPRLRRDPLIGANYTHYDFPNCTFERTSILGFYHEPRVARIVHKQLFQMRKAGIATIRTLIWHATHPPPDWLSVSSAAGKLHEPYRTNFIRFLREVRRFGFLRLTISFAPLKTNNPLLVSYRPAKFRENWRFVRTVRALVRRYGPASSRFDLFSEGAPNERPTVYEPRPKQTARYLRNLYRLYVKRFGNRDVSVSVIPGQNPVGETNRLEYLIKTLMSSGQPMPRWYDVHIGLPPSRVPYMIRRTESILSQYGQRQPLVIGDTGYDNRPIARLFKRYLQRSSRRIDEITPWYKRTPKGCQVPPPYKPGAYAEVLHPLRTTRSR
jgi:hypothetical protein